MEILARFLIGGILVSTFAVLGDMLKPKSFAGLFGAAPSIALATLALTIFKEGKIYATIEARSMAIGAVAFFLYATCVSWLLLKKNIAAKPAAFLTILLWMVTALGIWRLG